MPSNPQQSYEHCCVYSISIFVVLVVNTEIAGGHCWLFLNGFAFYLPVCTIYLQETINLILNTPIY